MTCELVYASYSLPKWRAVKLTFFAPCTRSPQVQTFTMQQDAVKVFTWSFNVAVP